MAPAPNLIALASLLSIVAFAAPRNEFVENNEATLVQTSTRASSGLDYLTQEYNLIKAQLGSGSQTTPAVKKAITKMTNLITTKIEVAIREGHKEDEELLKAHRQEVQVYNGAQTTIRDNLLGDARAVNANIIQHNKYAATWKSAASSFKTSISTYESATNKKTTTCCKKQQAAVEGLVVTNAFHMCDYKEGKDCTKIAVASVNQKVEQIFTNGIKLFETLDKGCNADEVARVLAEKDMKAKDKHCDDTQDLATSLAKVITTDALRLKGNWDKATTSYGSEMTKQRAQYKKNAAKVVKDSADRKEEWKASQLIKCMLEAYRAGGGFDEATEKGCRSGITVKGLHLVAKAPEARIAWTMLAKPQQTSTASYANACQSSETADEDKDKKCTIVQTPKAPVCTPSTPLPGKVGLGGPVWKLSAAGASVVSKK